MSFQEESFIEDSIISPVSLIDIMSSYRNEGLAFMLFSSKAAMNIDQIDELMGSVRINHANDSFFSLFNIDKFDNFEFKSMFNGGLNEAKMILLDIIKLGYVFITSKQSQYNHSDKCFETSYVCLRNICGNPVGLFVSRFDVTQARQAKMDFDRLSLMLENSLVSVVITDPDGKIEYVNQRFCEVTGYLSHEVIGQPPGFIQSGEATTEHYKSLWSTILSGKTWVGEMPNRTKEGRLLLERCAISPFFDDEGKIINFVATKENISEHHVLNLALKSMENQYQRLYGKLSSGFLLTQIKKNLSDQVIDYVLKEVNDAFLEMAGLSRLEFEQKGIYSFFSDQDSSWKMLFEEVANTGNTSTFEYFSKHIQHWYLVRLYSPELNFVAAMFQDVTEMKETQSKMLLLEHYDVLTGLSNRLFLINQISHLLQSLSLNKIKHALCHIDVDEFKNINEKYGYDRGDQLLINIGNRLSEVVSDKGVVARIAGDEFALILFDIENIEKLKKRMDQVFKAILLPFIINDNESVYITASFGVTKFPSDNVSEYFSPEVILRQSVHSTYEAKRFGINQVRYYDFDFELAAKEKKIARDRISIAIKRNELILYYQPKVNMLSGVVYGFEALVRWLHPEKGLLLPIDFLPDIEGSDIMIELGDFVLRSALAQMYYWKLQGLSLPVSVNVAARQLNDGFYEYLRSILSECIGIDGSHLELELLETETMGDLGRVSDIMRQCRAMGVRFALDDFGTGYSSLDYLKKLRVCILKIDQSFIREMMHTSSDFKIVEAIIGMARAFNTEVIAEGVETIDHGVHLVKMGCYLGQGYVIARPMPAIDIIPWVSNYQQPEEWRVLQNYQLPNVLLNSCPFVNSCNRCL